jgi:DNA-binding transcriptional MerR regulator
MGKAMKVETSGEQAHFRIGAVSRLTGVSPDALRIWERRYAAVSPRRSPGGGRLYRPGDVERLRLMKQLVDAGDAIGAIANLGLDELQARATAARRLPAGEGVLTTASVCRIALIGESLGQEIRAFGDTLVGIDVTEQYADTNEFETRGVDGGADVLVLQQATLHEDTAKQVIDWLIRARAAHMVIVYRYASAEALRRLPASRCSVLRAPMDASTLQAHCLSVMGAALVASAPAVAGAVTLQSAPPQRYDDEALAQLAALSSTVKCECPRHLAELIASLSAFERYSAECESRCPGDAALHAYLHATASQARHIIEGALDHVIEFEGIQLSGAPEPHS